VTFQVSCVRACRLAQFSRALECELLNRHRFRTQVEARLAAFDFIEGWYNPWRCHSALSYRSILRSPIDRP